MFCILKQVLKKVKIISLSLFIAASLLIVAGTNIFHVHEDNHEEDNCSVCILNSAFVLISGFPAVSVFLHTNIRTGFIGFTDTVSFIPDYSAVSYPDRAPPVI